MPWGSIVGSAIGAIGSLIGGHQNNQAAEEAARIQYQNQKEFAQNGIRWKVADAKAAGIHPLAGLGAQTFAYNPVAVQTGDGGIGDALSQMGQGVSRAFEAKRLQKEREADDARREMEDVFNLAMRNKQLEQMDLQNDIMRQQLKASQIAVAKTALPPPMPLTNSKGDATNDVTSSTTAGVSPFWDHFRNFDFITAVPSGDLKDYLSENMLAGIPAQMAYFLAALDGKVKPNRAIMTKEEIKKLNSGMYTTRYYPYAGWRVEKNLRGFLSKLIPYISPAALQLWLNKSSR